MWGRGVLVGDLRFCEVEKFEKKIYSIADKTEGGSFRSQAYSRALFTEFLVTSHGSKGKTQKINRGDRPRSIKKPIESDKSFSAVFCPTKSGVTAVGQYSIPLLHHL